MPLLQSFLHFGWLSRTLCWSVLAEIVREAAVASLAGTSPLEVETDLAIRGCIARSTYTAAASSATSLASIASLAASAPPVRHLNQRRSQVARRSFDIDTPAKCCLMVSRREERCAERALSRLGGLWSRLPRGCVAEGELGSRLPARGEGEGRE